MAIGDRTVKFDPDRIGIRVDEETARKKARDVDSLDPTDDDDIDTAARMVAMSRFWEVVTEQVGDPIEPTVYRTVHEGVRR